MDGGSDYADNNFGATAPSGGGNGGSRAGRGAGRRQGSAGGGLGAEVPARWVAGETGRVVARLSNPLRVPLEVESIVAVVEGARVQAFPTRVLLPPKAEFHEVRVKLANMGAVGVHGGTEDGERGTGVVLSYG